MIASFPSELWLNPSWYNFWSSEAGGITVKILTVLIALLVLKLIWPRIWKHFECDVEQPENCHRRGHVVAGTGHKACGEHHPHRHDKRESPITAQDILRNHEAAGGGGTSPASPPSVDKRET